MKAHIIIWLVVAFVAGALVEHILAKAFAEPLCPCGHTKKYVKEWRA